MPLANLGIGHFGSRLQAKGPQPSQPGATTQEGALAARSSQSYPFRAILNSSARSVILLRGVRHNNLKNFDLDLPLNQLIVITGLSGSAKSSRGFETVFAAR